MNELTKEELLERHAMCGKWFRDENESVWCYADEPKLRGDACSWIDGGKVSVHIPQWFKIHTRGTVDWKDSLIMRPEGE